MVWLTNERGDLMHLYQDMTGGELRRSMWKVTGSRSPVFAVSEAASTLVVRRGGEERREDLSLVESGITEVLVE